GTAGCVPAGRRAPAVARSRGANGQRLGGNEQQRALAEGPGGGAAAQGPRGGARAGVEGGGAARPAARQREITLLNGDTLMHRTAGRLAVVGALLAGLALGLVGARSAGGAEADPAAGLPRFTEEREAAALFFVKKQLPELLPLLEELKKTNAPHYER